MPLNSLLSRSTQGSMQEICGPATEPQVSWIHHK